MTETQGIELLEKITQLIAYTLYSNSLLLSIFFALVAILFFIAGLAVRRP